MQHPKFSKKQSEKRAPYRSTGMHEDISDDIIVFGKSQEEHDKNLRGVLQRLQENNLRLNKDKCEFSKTEIKFYGHIFSSSGFKPDPLKVGAIHKASPPWSSPEVEWFKHLKQEISVFNGFVLGGSRNIIPSTLRSKAVDLAHQSHQGMVKTK